MNDFVTALRDFEDDYNSRVGDNDIVQEAIHLRNVGWDSFRNGQKEPGIVNLYRSYSLLEGASPGLRFKRENYATTARIAQALCANGEFEKAAAFARDALEMTPVGFDYFLQSRRLADFGPVGTPVRMNAEFDVERPLFNTVHFPDQFEARFAGRMGLVLATVSDGSDIRSNIDLTARARFLAKRSEDRERMVFVNRGMTPEKRKATQARLTWVARAATVAVHSPLPVARLIAQKVCSK
jgi:hypothetical protein